MAIINYYSYNIKRICSSKRSVPRPQDIAISPLSTDGLLVQQLLSSLSSVLFLIIFLAKICFIFLLTLSFIYFIYYSYYYTNYIDGLYSRGQEPNDLYFYLNLFYVLVNNYLLFDIYYSLNYRIYYKRIMNCGSTGLPIILALNKISIIL